MNDLIALIQQKLQDLDNRINTLNKEMARLPQFEEDENLATLVGSLQSDINTLNTKVNNIQSTLSAIDTTYSTLVSGYENVSNNMEVAQRNISDLQSSTSTTINDLTIAKSNISELNETVADLTSKANKFEVLNHKVESIGTHLASIDNELYFVINGSYLMPDDLDHIVDGSYTI